MLSNKEYRDFILEQLSNLKPTSKPMMGELLIYVNGVYFGCICDDRLLVSKLQTLMLDIKCQKDCHIITHHPCI